MAKLLNIDLQSAEPKQTFTTMPHRQLPLAAEKQT